MDRFNVFLKLINSLQNISHGSQTQLTSKGHELKCKDILINTFACNIIDKDKFRKLLRNNNKKLLSKPAKETDVNRQCDREINIINNNISLIHNTNYLIYQPAGDQEYPDFILTKYITDGSSNRLILTYIECKQSIPTFNNNTPKMKENCIYICGNNIYSGFLLSTLEIEERRNEYKKKLIELAKEYSDINTKCIAYKKMELPWIINEGPQCFIDRKEQNIPLLSKCLIRYLIDEQSDQPMEVE